METPITVNQCCWYEEQCQFLQLWITDPSSYSNCSLMGKLPVSFSLFNHIHNVLSHLFLAVYSHCSNPWALGHYRMGGMLVASSASFMRGDGSRDSRILDRSSTSCLRHSYQRDEHLRKSPKEDPGFRNHCKKDISWQTRNIWSATQWNFFENET